MYGWVATRWHCFEMKKLRFSHLSDIRLMRGTELQSATSRLSFWLTHRLSSDPGSRDLLSKGSEHPEYLPGALPVVTRVLDPAIHYPGGLVDPVGWDQGWVPRGLHLKWRSLRGYCETHLRLNPEGGCWNVPSRPAKAVLTQLRPKKEPGVSDRDMNSLMDGVSFHGWSKVLEWYPTVYSRCWSKIW